MSAAITPRTTMAQNDLLADLQSIVGLEHAYPPEKKHHVDIEGMGPSVVVSPGTYEEVANLMRYANNNGLAVVPLGNGDFRSFGNIPSRYDIALKISRLNGIVEYEPADLTITCQAGATLENLHPSLSRNGQMVPFGNGPARSRIARLLALPRRQSNLAWGSARDFTIGLRVVTADGRIIRTGGKVVKNVAGYDLTKLFIASMGTLGVIVEGTFKLVPEPQAGDRVHVEFPSLPAACAFAHELSKRGLSLWYVSIDRPISLADAASSDEHYRSTAYLAGTADAVQRSRREAADLSAGYGGKLLSTEPSRDEGAPPAARPSGEHMSCESAVLPSLVPRLIQDIDSIAPGAFLDILPLEASVFMTWLDREAGAERVRRLRAATARLGASLVVSRCSPELKRQIDVFGEVPAPTLDLMRRIKHQFDPNGILSPGRFVGKL